MAALGMQAGCTSLQELSPGCSVPVLPASSFELARPNIKAFTSNIFPGFNKLLLFILCIILSSFLQLSVFLISSPIIHMLGITRIAPFCVFPSLVSESTVIPVPGQHGTQSI